MNSVQVLYGRKKLAGRKWTTWYATRSRAAEPYARKDQCEAPMAKIKIILPAHLRTLARVDGEVTLEVSREVTQGTVLDALEA